MDQLKKRYVSVDIESSGQYPWNSSMLSLGACIVGDIENNFYVELKPTTNEYLLDNFKIGASSLNCLKDYNLEKLDPKEVLEILKEKGQNPKEAIPNFVNWVLSSTKGSWPILAASPIIFDGCFVNYYINHFHNGENPFGYTGEDINSMFRGSIKNIGANIRDLKLREKQGLRHNALEDAIQQSKEFYTTLVHMQQNNF
jgi:hypothetical protein